jgi:two-component sensor histidine kinase
MALRRAEMSTRIAGLPVESWQRIERALWPRLTDEDRRILRVQVLLISAIIGMLFLGMQGTREWRRVAEQGHMYTVIRGWDGFAWLAWLLAVPAMFVLIRRYPLIRGRMRGNLAGILGGSLLLYLVITHARYLLHILPDLIWSPNRALLFNFETYAYNTFGLVPFDCFTYSGFFAVALSVDYYMRHRQRFEEALRLQLETARLQSDLARAELAALRGQLHPHFLFNSFNALATLVRQQKNEQAVEIIAQLSELLRLAMERTGLHEIPLHQELDFIRHYLEIEHLRYGEKLRTEFAVKPEVLHALVPNIVLQPLVENAIKHAISLRTNPGLVRVAGERREHWLHIEITDDGPEGPPRPDPEGRKRTGIGLANSRAQLEKLYGQNYRLEVLKRPEGGTLVRLDLPWRLAAAAEQTL